MDQPSQLDIDAIFQKLRSIPANKTCFDCNAKNPTWASVTYAIFICIDCSAVHRGLGVHLTFVRSTQLDTNWTWLQLRQMQVGGNANAIQFFSQHNCNTTDAQKKYNSRAANLYREKIYQSALKALDNVDQLCTNTSNSEKKNTSALDFFTEHENYISKECALTETKPEVSLTQKPVIQSKDGPKVDFSLTNTEERKSSINCRKVQPKKFGLGAKKGGLGATKVKTNFAQLEREAVEAEESRLHFLEESARTVALTVKEKEEREAAVRLAYKDLNVQLEERERTLKNVEPHKTEQMERLGMGLKSKSAVSHSVTSDLKTIEQENLQVSQTTLNSLGKLRLTDRDSFLDDFAYSTNFSMNRNSNLDVGNSVDPYYAENRNYRDNWVIVNDTPIDKVKSVTTHADKSSTYNDSADSDLAQKKFGSAKAISSEQFFTDPVKSYEQQTTLNRFQSSSSISSSEYFGNDKDNHNASKFQTPDMEDVRESVRQGVTKVAGKISSLANGVMSSLQERYGY